MIKIPQKSRPQTLKSRISLSYAWESLLWKHKDIDVIIEKLDSKDITLDEALNLLKGG